MTDETTSTPPEADAHVDGSVLLAVAEGDPDKQPSEEQLTHVFSCGECDTNLRELRASLRALSSDPGSLPDLDAGLSAFEAASELARNTTSAAEAKAGKSLRTMITLCVVLGLGALLLRTFADFFLLDKK